MLLSRSSDTRTIIRHLLSNERILDSLTLLMSSKSTLDEFEGVLNAELVESLFRACLAEAGQHDDPLATYRLIYTIYTFVSSREANYKRLSSSSPECLRRHTSFREENMKRNSMVKEIDSTLRCRSYLCLEAGERVLGAERYYSSKTDGLPLSEWLSQEVEALFFGRATEVRYAYEKFGLKHTSSTFGTSVAQSPH